MLRRFVHTAFLLLAMQSCWAFAPAIAQGFPQRPITIVVTFPPGGSADVVARALDPKVSAQLGQSLIIENRPSRRQHRHRRRRQGGAGRLYSNT